MKALLLRNSGGSCPGLVDRYARQCVWFHPLADATLESQAMKRARPHIDLSDSDDGWHLLSERHQWTIPGDLEGSSDVSWAHLAAYLSCSLAAARVAQAEILRPGSQKLELYG